MSDTPNGIEELAQQLKAISELLAREQPPQLPPARANRVRKTIGEAFDSLRKVVEDLDPVKHPGFVFDPSNPAIIGRLVGITMIAQDRKPLGLIEKFYGSGVYAIYYSGDFPAYALLSGKEHPIYVGKAGPAVQSAKTAIEQGDRLSRRLGDHKKNIAKAATTLKLEDFQYRALVVQSGWQESAESYLIHLFKPIWNSEMKIGFGFGKHGDDPVTRANLRSPWDTLHPGRDWAHRGKDMRDSRTADRIAEDIARHLAKYSPFETTDQILRVFLEEIRAGS